jgi:hypothetical protein
MAKPMTGMLGDVFSPSQRDVVAEEQYEDRRLQSLSNMGGTQQANLAALMGAQMAGKGFGGAVASAAGKDPRSNIEKHTAAVQAAKDEVAGMGFDPEDPKSMDAFYKNVINVLRGKGLFAEAMLVAREWEEKKRGDHKAKLETDKLDLQNRDLARKEKEGAAKAAAEEARTRTANERNNILREAGKPEYIKIVERIEKEEDPNLRKLLTDRANQMAGQVGLYFEDTGGSIIVRRKDGSVLATDPKTAAPEKAKDAAKDKQAKENALESYEEYMAGLQRHYDAAVQLHNHRGLSGITGKFGRWTGEPGMMATLYTIGVSDDDALAALGKYDQVAGGAFLAGLAKLKAASKTGATGLGAVSEKEGDKVQSDAAALNRYQQAPDFRSSLAAYLNWLEGHAERAYKGAVEDAAALGRPAPAMRLAERQLSTPSGQGGRSSNPPLKPKAQPKADRTTVPGAPSAGPDSDRVNVIAPDGTKGTISRSKLEAAKRRGYTEAQ